MQDSFWNKHYQNFTVHEPSRFARYCLENHLNSDDTVVELGCGNGRDGLVLSRSVSRYIGLDACSVAVGAFRKAADALPSESARNIDVRQGDFTKQDFNSFCGNSSRLVIYSRFSLHTINYVETDRLLTNIASIRAPWALLLEARTIFDTLYGQGTNVGLHEFTIDHYRRFIDPVAFRTDMEAHFDVSHFEVASGFAPHGNEDPVLMRAVIQPRILCDGS